MTAAGRAKAAARKVRELALVRRALPLPAIRHGADCSNALLQPLLRLRNEYDKVSEPVPVAEMERRIDHLGRLGTSIITISGGEPLTPSRPRRYHPPHEESRHHGRDDHQRLPAQCRAHRGGSTRRPRPHADLNRQHQPDDVSKKSLKVLDKKLEMLAEHAEFHVNINSVVGGGIKNPGDALVISKRALELGFSNTIGIIHDGSGQLKPLLPRKAKIYFEVRNLERRNYSRFNQFQEAIAQGKPNDCVAAPDRATLHLRRRPGALLLQQRGFPGVPIAEYTTEDVKREFLTAKSCSPNCTIAASTRSATSTLARPADPHPSRPADTTRQRRNSLQSKAQVRPDSSRNQFHLANSHLRAGPRARWIGYDDEVDLIEML